MQTTLTLSPQQLQQFSFHSNPQQLTHQVIQAPPVIKAPPVIQQNQTTQIDDDEDDDENYGGDHQFVLEVEDESLDDSNLHRLGKEEDLNTSASSTSMNNSFPAKQMKAENALSPKSLTKLQNQQQQHSETAKKQLKRMSSHSIKHQSDAVQKSTESTLTTCEVCQKTFKRKEHLTQHLKSHVGLRPFKCDEPQCNKSFSRKEHLIRHVVSHTGKKIVYFLFF